MDSLLSKSEKKRRAKGLEQLVFELADLPVGEIALLPCDQEIRDHVSSAKNLKGGARKRQLKYVTKLLRDRPVEELYDFMVRQKGSILKEKRELQKIEHFRNLLISEAVQDYEKAMLANGFANENEPVELLQESEVLQTIVRQLPNIDVDLLKSTAMQFARSRNRKFRRELFRILRAAAEKAQFSQKEV